MKCPWQMVLFLLFLLRGAASGEPDWREEVRFAAESVLEETATPGAVVAFRTPDGRDELFAVGFADPETNRPMRTDLVFPAGSLAKSFVATLALLAFEEGALDPDDPIGRFADLPEEAAVRSLSTLGDHTARLPDAIWQREFQREIIDEPDRKWIPSEIIAFVPWKAMTAPGEPRYSNLHTILLGIACENAYEQPLETLIAEKVFEPLGLSGTALRIESNERRPMPRGYRFAAAGWPIGYGKVFMDVTRFGPGWTHAAGSLYTTASDLSKACRPIIEGELVGDREKEKLTEWTEGGDWSVAYGFGLEKWGDWIGHRGDVPGYQSFFAIHGQTDTEVVVLANLSNLPEGPGPAERIAAAVLEALWQ